MKNKKNTFGRFLLLWSGDFISAIGSGLTSFGLGVYIFQQTGKASLMALVTLLAFLPSLVLSIPAGVLADRYDRRLLMILGDSLSATGLIFILFCFLLGEAHVWVICIGVTISSVFSSLLEPAYKAAISDLLTPEQYSKASGLVQAAGSAKYLISPVLAGFLLTAADVPLLLIIDISTFAVTVITTLAAGRGLIRKKSETITSFLFDMKEGWDFLRGRRGLMTLVFMGTLITFCLGIVQTLASPMILSFTSSSALGTLMTAAASGMLVSSLLLGAVNIKSRYGKLLSLSLLGAGIFMILFGLRENILFIGVSGFLFFAMLPFANTSIDCMLRMNIDNVLQGRVWGLTGFISQLGYVAAYAASGLLADYVFTPMLVPDGPLAGSLGCLIGTGTGRGIGFMIILGGGILCVTAFLLMGMKSIQKLG